VCIRHDVTRGGALIAARQTVPWPALVRPARLVHGRQGVARLTARSLKYCAVFTGRCTRLSEVRSVSRSGAGDGV
jgi:hypothetical protein